MSKHKKKKKFIPASKACEIIAHRVVEKERTLVIKELREKLIDTCMRLLDKVDKGKASKKEMKLIADIVDAFADKQGLRNQE